MNRFLAVLAAAMVCLAPSGHADQGESTPLHVKFAIVLDSPSDYFTGQATGGMWIEPGDEAAATFYGSDSSTGVTTGMILRESGELRFELPIAATFYRSPERLLLVGNACLINLSNGADIASGHRVEFKRTITLDSPALIPVGNFPDGVGVGVEITVSTEPKVHRSQLTRGLQVITVQTWNGVVQSVASSGRVISPHPDTIDNTFSLSGPLPDSRRVLKYSGIVSFSQDIAKLQATTPITLTFVRKYAIDTLHYAATPFAATEFLTSKNSRVVTVTPGEVLKVVIPPDTPSVGGFDITDTLIVVPPK